MMKDYIEGILKFENVDTFEEELKKIIKEAYFEGTNIVDWLRDVFEQWQQTGMNSFELPKYSTKTGRPELVNFETELISLNDEETKIVIRF